ncbi:MAG TPA: energy transducer TonB [Chthoniobacteraceae bacterium]|jgi:outer membrane biosynthesis protein TonB|nr:energy transducer TonB [Chthoniobacteraceae bacterium]
MSDRQKLFYALLASALFHVVLIVCLGMVWAVAHTEAVVKVLPGLSHLTVTIMPAPKPEPAPAQGIAVVPTPVPLVKPDIDSDGLKKSSKAPAKTLFQSDSNMVAGSRLPATGYLPLPSLAGPQRSFIDFANRASTMGKGKAPLAPSAGRPAAAPMPVQTPSAVTRVENQPQRLAKATPQPSAQPTPKPIPTAAPNMLALGTPTPTPAPPQQFARLTAAPSLRAGAEIAPLPKPQPPSPSRDEAAMQREMHQTHVDGGITARGEPGVDAVESPYGRYHRTLSNLIGSRWRLYMQETPKDVGEVTILIHINPNGKVASTQVIGNHSIDGLADLSVRAIMDSKLPPVPDDLAPMMQDGKLDIRFDFTVYDFTHDSPGR